MDEEKQEQREESRGLTFKDILFILRKNWIAIVVFILAGGIGGFVWSKVQQTVAPVYQASGVIMVSPEGTTNQTQSADYTLSNNLTNTVVAFIKTNAVLDHVREDKTLIGQGYHFSSSKLSVSNTTGNLMITIRYSSKTSEESMAMVNAVMDSVLEEADRMKEDGVTPVYHMLKNNLNVVDTAKKGTAVSHTTRNLALGLGAGVAVALLYTVIKELSDNTFKSSEEIERMLNIPVLAGIPEYQFDDEKKGGK